MATMTIRLTRKAEDRLVEYLDDVRRSMEATPGMDAADVVAGIREHVEAELGAAGTTEATAEDVADVIARLGPPSAWGTPGAEAEAGAKDPSHSPTVSGAWPIAGGSLLVALGLPLAFTARWAGLGWILLISGTLVLRLASSGDEGLPSRHRPAERLAVAWWRLAAAAGALALLLAPAVLAWGAAQIGGPLEAPLAARIGVDGYPRSWTYWGATAAVGAFATGLWWITIGTGVRLFTDGLRRALGSSRYLVGQGVPRRLVVSGLALVALSLLGLLLPGS